MEEHMFLKYRFWIVCATLALLLIFALMFLEWAVDRESPGILASYLLRNNGERQTISLPFSERQPDNRATYEYIVELVWKEGLHTRFQVVPDDYLESITVNGRLMPEVRYSGPGRSDYVNGLIVDFQSYLREGKNEIVFRILNHGGAYGMDIKGVQLQYSSLRIVALSLSILSCPRAGFLGIAPLKSGSCPYLSCLARTYLAAYFACGAA